MNFIIFIADEMRAESVSCYGHPLVKMPNFDRISCEGVLFEQCHVQHTVCTPSRCSMMTGWYPHVSGHRTLWNMLKPHEPSLFKYLKEMDYHIEWYGRNDLYSQESLHSIPDTYINHKKNFCGSSTVKPEEDGYYGFLNESYGGKYEDITDIRNVQAGIEFLRAYRKNDKPFILYLPLYMPHPPYSAPHLYHQMYNLDDIPELRNSNLDGKPDFHSLIRKYRKLDKLPNDFFRKIQAVYLGMNSFVDQMLGSLLDTLDETGLNEETTLVVTSDHGDWAGDYGLVEKWPSALDDTLTRVPLIIRSPGNKTGHIVKEQVELFDVMPTILELAGIQATHTHFAKSLVSQLGGAHGDSERAVFAEGGYNINEQHCFEGNFEEDSFWLDKKQRYYPKGLQQQEEPQSVCRATMIRTMQYKLIMRSQGVNELYDLGKDPKELNNLYFENSYIRVVEQLKGQMLKWYIQTSDVVPLTKDSRKE